MIASFPLRARRAIPLALLPLVAIVSACKDGTAAIPRTCAGTSEIILLSSGNVRVTQTVQTCSALGAFDTTQRVVLKNTGTVAVDSLTLMVVRANVSPSGSGSEALTRLATPLAVGEARTVVDSVVTGRVFAIRATAAAAAVPLGITGFWTGTGGADGRPVNAAIAFTGTTTTGTAWVTFGSGTSAVRYRSSIGDLIFSGTTCMAGDAAACANPATVRAVPGVPVLLATDTLRFMVQRLSPASAIVGTDTITLWRASAPAGIPIL
jgi:hypothetical protein